MIDTLTNYLLGGNPRTANDLMRWFAYRNGLKAGMLIGVVGVIGAGVIGLALEGM